MPSDAATAEPPQAAAAIASEIADRFKWNLNDIFRTGRRGRRATRQLDAGIDRYAALKGTLAQGRRTAARRVPAVRGARPARLSRLVLPVAAVRRGSARQHRQRAAPAGADPVRATGSRRSRGSAPSCCRFRSRPSASGWTQRRTLAALPLRDRGSLPPAGARARRGGRAADVAREPPRVVAERRLLGALDGGRASSRRSRCRTARRSRSRTASTARSSRRGASRRIARRRSRALHETYQATLNTYATLYNGVCQRDWFQARARGYKSTLEAALHGDNIPTSVVENLIETTRAGVEPLRRYHRLRRRALGVPSYHVYDFSIPLVTFDKKYQYDDVLDWIVDAVAPLGPDYQARMREGLRRAAGSTSTRTKASGRAPTRRRCTARTRTCS